MHYSPLQGAQLCTTPLMPSGQLNTAHDHTALPPLRRPVSSPLLAPPPPLFPPSLYGTGDRRPTIGKPWTSESEGSQSWFQPQPAIDSSGPNSFRSLWLSPSVTQWEGPQHRLLLLRRGAWRCSHRASVICAPLPPSPGTEPDTVPPSENHDSADSPIPRGELIVGGGSYPTLGGLSGRFQEEVKI